MKKLLLLAGLAGMLATPAGAQYAASAETDVYDLSKFGDEILDVFYDALQQGRKYPTMAEFAAKGIDPIEINFVRSHVRPRSIMLDHSKDVNQNVAAGRPLWMNVPLGIGKEQGGYPNSNFTDDTFTGWNYTRVFGSWNNGLFHCPGVVTDAGHKHGTDVYSGIKFFDTTGNPGGVGAGDWMNVLATQDAKGYAGYKYVEPLINCLMYFGQDGINYNWEDSGFTNSNVVGFHQACYKLAKERKFDNFHIGIYTSYSQLTNGNTIGLYGQNGVKTADAFLNYSGGDFAGTAMQSVNTALQQNIEDKNTPSLDGVYQGCWIVGMNRSWKNLVSSPQAKKIGVVLWGEHNESRLHSYCSGNDAVDFHENYQKLQDRFFSGGYRNPAVRPDPTIGADWMNEDESRNGLRTFQGLAEYVPERTALKQNLPFTTYFNTGSGDRYFYKGKKTAGSWYNLGTQDYQPTYRWLVYKKGTTTAVKDGAGVPELTGADGYIGGNALRLTNTQAVDIVLYRCELTCSAGNPKATIALKRYEGAPAGTVSVIVKKKGSDEWVETAFANVKGNTWEEQTVSLNGIAKGDVIEYVGLRTSGDTKGLLVGELSLNDDVKVTPAAVKDLLVDVKEETQQSLSLKLAWDVEATAKTRADFGLVYNDEAGIDQFQVLYKDGENGRVSEVSRTTSWSTYVGNIPMDSETDPYIGVRSLSVDGKSYSQTVWVHVPRAEASQLPETSAAMGAYPASTLNMGSEGIEAALHNRFVTGLSVTGGVESYNYTNNVGTPYYVDKLAGKADKDCDKSNYILAEKPIKVKQGQTLNCSLSYNSTKDYRGGTSVDDMHYCTARGYMDFDGDHQFNGGNDEVVWQCGKSNAKKENTALTNPTKFSFKIPEDAVVGESRLRLVFSDAWFPHPGPTGVTSKGFTIDFPVEISGTNQGRTSVDKHDQGIADEPVGFGEDPTGVHTVQNAAVSRAQLTDGAIEIENADKVWVYGADGRVVKYLPLGGNVNTTGFTPGTYLVRMQSGAVIRSQKVVVK
ncbi:MAG: GEVED domain-containing protein [Bacteroidaceae bacterium]|nr:GEVED domain-containing protein [Bacteroidaceae bacterium]